MRCAVTLDRSYFYISLYFFDSEYTHCWFDTFEVRKEELYTAWIFHTCDIPSNIWMPPLCNIIRNVCSSLDNRKNILRYRRNFYHSFLSSSCKHPFSRPPWREHRKASSYNRHRSYAKSISWHSTIPVRRVFFHLLCARRNNDYLYAFNWNAH